MERSAETVSAIRALGYPGGSCLTRCGCDELPCPLLTWLSAELRTTCPELPDSGGTGDVLLVGELRNLLSDMFSPPTVVTLEVLEPSTLNTVVDFLVSELQAARMIQRKEVHPEEKTTGEESAKEQRVADHSQELCREHEDDDVSDHDRRKAEMQAEWILLLRALDMDASSQLADVLSEVESRLARLPCGGMMEPLLNTSLSSEQWERSEVVASVPSLASSTGSSQVSLSHLLAAREDQSFIEPIKAGTSTPVYKTRMGSVPDRGGRPGEIEPPMPAWEERRAKGNRWGRGGGHHQRRKFSDKKKGKKA
ncbi:protein FAM98B isoform X3 [Trachinotus anak]|uniref:protein FAM98B isoform X3 n=1 Tax=Trachinotus anak TaxID=443729 RepID=UPI0039F245BD